MTWQHTSEKAAPISRKASTDRRPTKREQREAEWLRVHQTQEPRRLYGGWARYFDLGQSRYYYLPPHGAHGSPPKSQWDPPFNIAMGPNGGVDFTKVKRVAVRLAINQIPDLTPSEKLILHEFVAPVQDPPDIAWIHLQTLAENSGTNRQTVYRAVFHFEELGIVEWIPRKAVASSKLSRLHPRTQTFRFLPGEWLLLQPQ